MYFSRHIYTENTRRNPAREGHLDASGRAPFAHGLDQSAGCRLTNSLIVVGDRVIVRGAERLAPGQAVDVIGTAVSERD